MNVGRASRALAVLATPQARAVLEAIKDAEWHIPSAAAARAKVHVSTASKDLAILHESGVLERKQVRTATGRSYAYRLPRPTITLTLDVGTRSPPGERSSATPTLGLLTDVIRKGDAMGGTRFRGRAVSVLVSSFPEELAAVRGADLQACLGRLSALATLLPEDRVLGALRAVRELLESSFGSLVSDRILQASLEDAGESPPALRRSDEFGDRAGVAG